MKKTGAILDAQNDKTEMFKQPVPLGLTSSGHNYVDIRDKDNTENQNKDVVLTTVAEEEVLLVIGNVSPAKASQTLRSGISRQAAEAHSKLMEQRKKECLTIQQQVIQDYDTCQRYRNRKPKPLWS